MHNMHIRGIDFASVPTIFRLVFGSVPTVWYILIFILLLMSVYICQLL